MKENKLLVPIILGAAIIAAAAVFGVFFYFARTSPAGDVLAVTGSVKARVTSDQAKLVIAITRTATNRTLSTGYDEMAKDAEAVKSLLKNGGFEDKNINEVPVSMNQVFDQSGPTDRYQFNETITLQSSDIAKVTDIYKKVTGLSAQGMIVSVQSLEYYYSKLPDLRVSLLADAIKDAKSRAAKVAEGTGRRVGEVQAASIGVVQVLAPNSVDISDYGSYDTSSIEKDVMVTVKASFRLK
jgi:uncharacterized protein